MTPPSATVQLYESDKLEDEPVRNVVSEKLNGRSGPAFTAVGIALTVTVADTLQPFVFVYVMMLVPADTPVTKPALVIVATNGFDETHGVDTAAVPLPLNVTELPAHTFNIPEIDGNAFTVTKAVVLLQPVAVFVKVKLTVPADTPVTTPALVTVATALLLLVHVPPVTGDSVIVFPTHTDDGAVTTGFALTVTEVVVLLQPVAVFVKVKLAVPADTPVTTPALVTVAIALLLLVHVPPVTGDKVIVLPTHTDDDAETTGFALTVTDEVVLLQPVAVFVKVKVAVPADTPVTTPALVTVAMVLLLLVHVPPVTGDKVIVFPIHTDAGELTAGFPFIVTVADVLHPSTLV